MWWAELVKYGKNASERVPGTFRTVAPWEVSAPFAGGVPTFETLGGAPGRGPLDVSMRDRRRARLSSQDEQELDERS